MVRVFKADQQFEWTGTQDFAPTLSIAAALDFRKSIGGEERIMEYCHTLAVEWVSDYVRRCKS